MRRGDIVLADVPSDAMKKVAQCLKESLGLD